MCIAMQPHKAKRQYQPQANATPPLLTRFDAAYQANQSVRTIDEAIAKGDIEIVRIGRSVRIRPIALERFLEARTTRVNPKKAKAARRESAAKREGAAK